MVDSIAYGESLLSDIRARNDKLRKQAEKDARKKEWTNMAVNIGKSVFTDIYAEKQNRLMQNEDVVANKLLMQNVNDKHKAFAAEIREADKVGRDTYYYDQVDKLMDAQLRNMYGAQGTYNESNYQTLKAKMVKGYLPEYKKAFEDREAAHKSYNSTGNMDNYNKYIDQRVKKEASFIGDIRRIIGVDNLGEAGLGQMDKAIGEVTLYVDDAKTIKGYQDAYAITRNASLSTYLAEQNKERVDLGKPQTKIVGEGYTVTETNMFGDKIETQMLKAQTGNTIHYISHDALNGTQSKTETDVNLSQKHKILSARILNEDKAEFGATQYNQSPYYSNIRESIKEITNNRHADDVVAAADSLKFEKEIAASVTAAARILYDNGIVPDYESGAKIQLKLIDDYLEKNRERKNVTLPSVAGNIIETMFIADEMQAQGVIRERQNVIGYLLDDKEELYHSLALMDVSEREGFMDRFLSMDYFQGTTSDGTPVSQTLGRQLAIADMSKVLAAVNSNQNPRQGQSLAAFIEGFQYQQGGEAVEKSTETNETGEVVTEGLSAVESLVNVPRPDELKNARGRAVSKHAGAFIKLERLAKRADDMLEKQERYESRSFATNAGKEVYAKIAKQAQDNYEAFLKEYMTTYYPEA